MSQSLAKSHRRRSLAVMGLFLITSMTDSFAPQLSMSHKTSLLATKTQPTTPPQQFKRPTHEENMRLLDDVVKARPFMEEPEETVSKTAKAILQQAHESRALLVTNNMGLVHFCVTEMVGPKLRPLQSLSREDLIQEGSIGLARAIDRWNPDIGGRFSTYAVYWVRAAVNRCMAQRDDIVRVPEHVSTAIRKMIKASKELQIDISKWTHESYPATEFQAIATEAGLSVAQLERALQMRKRRQQGVLSLEPWMQPKIKEPTTTTTADVRPALELFLRPKEVEALSWRYGLGDAYTSRQRQAKQGENMSFSQVGDQMKISAEYGRQLCHRALAKLRDAADRGVLEPAALCG